MPDHSDSAELLTAVLKPLLEDFQEWFQQSLNLLESKPISFLSPEQQTQLAHRVKTALAEAQTAQMLLRVTNSQVGVEASQVLTWHSLVAECWAVSRRLRQENAASG
ncbi:MAG: DUF2605 domain-containing protein [Cyanobacteria bacterium Co-bin8]|nr:DUF2605 domain-containing protein [Cyanobacteria bacterium Co-bin8]